MIASLAESILNASVLPSLKRNLASSGAAMSKPSSIFVELSKPMKSPPALIAIVSAFSIRSASEPP